MTEDEQFPVVDLPVEVAESKKVKSAVTVKAVNYVADRRRAYILVADVDDPKKVWLLEAADVPDGLPFEVTKTFLAKAAKPYDFSKEVSIELPTIEEVVQAFWQKGIFTKDDLTDVLAVRNALASVLPSPNTFTKYAKEVTQYA